MTRVSVIFSWIFEIIAYADCQRCQQFAWADNKALKAIEIYLLFITNRYQFIWTACECEHFSDTCHSQRISVFFFIYSVWPKMIAMLNQIHTMRTKINKFWANSKWREFRQLKRIRAPHNRYLHLYAREEEKARIDLFVTCSLIASMLKSVVVITLIVSNRMDFGFFL